MGGVVSRVKILLGVAVQVNYLLDIVSARIKKSPGLPVPNPSQPLWSVPRSAISWEPQALPLQADVVIIGSGITGTSIAYTLLGRESSLNVLVLEAREVCSGATARNGGHVNPPLYQDFEELKEQFGEEIAKKMIKFRLLHLSEFKAIADAEDITKFCQFRETEHFEVHLGEQTWEDSKASLEVWKAAMPEESGSFQCEDGPGLAQQHRFSPDVVGFIHGDGGAIHPYRFVTSLLGKLLERHPTNFRIATQTPCTGISPPTAANPLYTVTTPRGTIQTPHIIHATNGWCSHLLEPMREKIIPIRGIMSAQRPGSSLSPSTMDGLRSFVFYSGHFGYDYLTQLPTGEHELMLGGGWASNMESALSEVGATDDSGVSVAGASHLAGALPVFFGDHHWGREKAVSDQECEEDGVKWGQGRTKASWSGILGISADGMPWVGRLPTKVSGRAAPAVISTPRVKNGEGKDTSKSLLDKEDRALTAAPGEWICAGYTGEGMVHAWMSGKALAHMVLGREEDIEGWFPNILRVTEKRWKKADIVDMIARRLS